MGRDHRKLRAFELADELAQLTYRETDKYPEHEFDGIVQQLRKAAVAVPTNIIDGCSRSSRREYLHCLRVAFSALREVGYLFELSRKLEFIDEEKFEELNAAYDEAAKLLAGLIRSLKD